MKLMVVCGSGLGSSFMVEMNIKAILKELNISGLEVEHCDLGSATPGSADVFIGAKDMADSMTHLGEVVSLDSIIDKDELRQKISEVLKDKGIIK